MQAHFVARSRVFNFPDVIAVQVQPELDADPVVAQRLWSLGFRRQPCAATRWLKTVNEALR